MARRSPHGLIGGEFLYEHVHLNFEGNYLVARALAEQIGPLLSASAEHPWPTADDCARRLGWSDYSRSEAEVKIFLTASPEARAGRRARELAERGDRADYAAILADIARRDARDSQRSEAPLRAAADAVPLDTTAMSVEAAFAESVRIVESRRRPS